MNSKNNAKIQKLITGSYEPTLADCKRIYNDYSLNKGLAGVLSDVFEWLSQEPISRTYKGGTAYLRAEADKDMILCVHCIFLNDKNVFIDEKFGNFDDITIYSLKSFFSDVIKDYIDEYLLTREKCI